MKDGLSLTNFLLSFFIHFTTTAEKYQSLLFYYRISYSDSLSVCLFVFDQTVCDLQVHCLFETFNPISSISQTCFLRPFQHLISTPLQKKYLSLIFRHRISLSLIVVVVSIHDRLSFSLISDLSLSYFLQEFSSSSKLLNTFRVHFHWTKFSLIRSSDGAHGEASCHGLE